MGRGVRSQILSRTRFSSVYECKRLWPGGPSGRKNAREGAPDRASGGCKKHLRPHLWRVKPRTEMGEGSGVESRPGRQLLSSAAGRRTHNIKQKREKK